MADYEKDNSIEEKYGELEADDILAKLSQDSEFTEAIESIFNESYDFNELESKTILLIQQYLTKINGTKNKNDPEIDVHKIAKDLDKISRNHIKNIKLDFDDPDIDLTEKGKLHLITGQAKKDLIRTIKNIAVYEVYKAMNPRRIAGETSKENYLNNVVLRGHKIASLHAGGSKSNLKDYTQNEINVINRKRQDFKKGGGLGL
jgi:hypothetical protein